MPVEKSWIKINFYWQHFCGLSSESVFIDARRKIIDKKEFLLANRDEDAMQKNFHQENKSSIP